MLLAHWLINIFIMAYNKSSSSNKQIAKNTIYLYTRLLVSLVIGLYTSRVILEVLGVDDYGIYNIVGGFVAMLAILTNTIRSAAQRFITYALGEGNIDKLKDTLSTFITLYLLLAAIVFIVGEVVGQLFLEKILVLPDNRIDAAYYVFHCSLLVFVFNLISIPFNASIIAHEKMNFFALVSIAESVLKLLVVYLLYVSPFDSLKTYSTSLSVVSIIICLIYVLYCRYQFEEVKGRLYIRRSIFRDIFSYSVWVTIGSSSAIVKEQGVNIVINNFFGVAMNAAKGVSTQVDHVVNMFASNIGTAISPQITKAYAAGDIERSIRLTFVMAKVQGILLLLLCIPLITETEYVLNLWLKDVPYYAVTFTRWVLVLCITRTLGGSIVPLLLATGKVKYVQIVSGSIMLLNLPLAYIALRMGLEPVSTMIIGIIIELIALLSGSLFLKHYVGFPVVHFWMKSILSVLLVSILASILPLIFKSFLLPEGFLSLIIVVGVSSIMVFGLSYYIVLNNAERKLVFDYIKKKVHNTILSNSYEKNHHKRTL